MQHRLRGLNKGSGVTDGGAGVRTALPGKLNVKTRPPLTVAYILIFSIIFVFSRLLLLAFFVVFSGF